MRFTPIGALAVLALTISSAHCQSSPIFREKRQSASDLEVGGSLTGLAAESTRYITRNELLNLPQVRYTVSDDINFAGATVIQGVSLEVLAKRLGSITDSELVVAICDDGYLANYPRSYLIVHHPVLVLNVNGKPPAGWPKETHDHTFDMGPYMISHPHFTPSYTVLSHVDEAQIPWGVVRIEFRSEKIVFDAIAPRGPHSQASEVQAGFRIAQQNCFRCHNAGNEGGRKSGRSWQQLGTLAAQSPHNFAAYVRDPVTKNLRAQMPANAEYDDATLAALTAYFQTFTENKKP